MYGTSEDQPDRLEDSDKAQSDDERVSVSDQSENENTTHKNFIRDNNFVNRTSLLNVE